MSANIIVKPLAAQLTHDTEHIGKMSPYVIAILGYQIRTTNVARRAGKTPGWDMELGFRYRGEEIIYFEVWQKDMITRDDLIGTAECAISSLFLSNFKTSRWIPLKFKSRPAGQLLVDIEFFPDGDKSEMFKTICNSYQALDTAQGELNSSRPSVPVLQRASIAGPVTNAGLLERPYLYSQQTSARV
jgi:Ca2+-dependent lipid-binding protein